MALPDFGLMTKEDKLKLDGIDTSTLLTKTEASSTYLTLADVSGTYLSQASASETYLTIAAASDTYATKAEMREYIRQVIESDTGYVFLNGNSSEIALIPTLVEEKALVPATNITLSTTPSRLTVNANATAIATIQITCDGDSDTIKLSLTGATDTAYNTATLTGRIITIAGKNNGSAQNLNLRVEAVSPSDSVSCVLPFSIADPASAPEPEPTP